MTHLMTFFLAGQLTTAAATPAPDFVAMREMIETLQRQLDAQQQTIALLRNQLAAAAPPAAAPPTQTAASQTAASPTAPGQTATTGGTPPEMPQNFVAAGDFPGSITIPGTDTALKIGGEARATLVHTLGPLGTDDRFIASSIPVGAPPEGDAARVTYIAGPSRVNFDLRSPSVLGGLRTFVEYDFMGQGGTALLRHAFIQTGHWLFGQTWSTFSDPEAQPDDIDYEGLNAISLFRQAQIRYTHAVARNLDVSLSVENPAPDLTGATGVNMSPDFVARIRWEPGTPAPHHLNRFSHVQAAVLARALRGQISDHTGTTYSTGGFGMNVSGVVMPRWDPYGTIKFATNNGWGIGRYIKDLEALGGQDAVFDPSTAELRALPAASGYIGYERQWHPQWQTGLTVGLVRVSNLDIQPGTALKRTERTSASVTWSPVPRADFVFEFLAGRRVDKDDQQGTSTQVQAGWKLKF